MPRARADEVVRGGCGTGGSEGDEAGALLAQCHLAKPRRGVDHPCDRKQAESREDFMIIRYLSLVAAAALTFGTPAHAA